VRPLVSVSDLFIRTVYSLLYPSRPPSTVDLVYCVSTVRSCRGRLGYVWAAYINSSPPNEYNHVVQILLFYSVTGRSLTRPPP
jgi:hypothetical protein